MPKRAVYAICGVSLTLLIGLAGCSPAEVDTGPEEDAGDTASAPASIGTMAQAPSSSGPAAAGRGDDAPAYEVDPFWPRPLPNDWILGQVSGIAVDNDDNIWIIQRPRTLTAHEAGAVQNPPATECCYPAPSVIAFDRAGEVIHAWGGPTWNQERAEWVEPEDGWPTQEHGIYIDHEDNVWIGGNGQNDHVVLKLNMEGERLLTIGQWQQTRGSNDAEHLGRPADITVDAETNEVYIADGYGNRRVIVLDADTGEYKRHWGAYGNTPDDSIDISSYDPDAPLESWHSPVHAVKIANDGLVYVADRAGNRIHVFNKDGSFVMEGLFAAWTIVQGSAWDLEFSRDPEQRWLFVADGANMKVWILRREDLSVAGSFGHGGRQAGQFNWVHNITADSFGNLYTSEVNTGKRVQKFVPVAAN
jgi:hypothetical protein